MKNVFTYIIVLIALIIESVLEKHIPILALGFLFIFILLIIIDAFLDRKYIYLHLLNSSLHYVLTYILILYMILVAIVFFSYSTTPHTFIIIMLALLAITSIGFAIMHISNIYQHIKKEKA